MTNLALGLAQLGFWLLTYLSIDRWVVNLVGFDLRNVVPIGMIILMWGAVLMPLKRVRVSIPISAMYVLLAVANVLSLLALVLHAYNASLLSGGSGAALTVDEIMVPQFSMVLESYMRTAYPLVKVVLLASTAALVASLVRRSRIQKEPSHERQAQLHHPAHSRRREP